MTHPLSAGNLTDGVLLHSRREKLQTQHCNFAGWKHFSDFYNP